MADIAVQPPPGAGTATAAGRSLSGLTEDESRSFHRMFVISFLGFLAIAIVAHILVWQWRPWIPGTPGYPVVNSSPTVSAPAQ
jgi:light-harvesting complex 1 beta chain